jgi:hypothetical protein
MRVARRRGGAAIFVCPLLKSFYLRDRGLTELFWRDEFRKCADHGNASSPVFFREYRREISMEPVFERQENFLVIKADSLIFHELPRACVAGIRSPYALRFMQAIACYSLSLCVSNHNPIHLDCVKSSLCYRRVCGDFEILD